MRRDLNYLFHDGDLNLIIREREQNLVKEINGFEPNYLLNANVDDLCQYLEQKYRFEAPTLREKETDVAKHCEADIDVSQDPMRWISDRSRPFYLKGTATTFAVPFDGDPQLFKYKPSSFSTSLPLGVVTNNELHLEFKSLNHDAAAVRAQYDRSLTEIQQYLGWVKENVAQFNGRISQTIRQGITERREKLLKDQGMAASLGFPIRKRDGAPQTYSVPITKRVAAIRRPSAVTTPYKPEPVLETKEYEHILSIISNMVKVMERSPKTFINMEEEDLRQHFLVQLNGQYEGNATGETFNYEGKTDILIRTDGQNIFIAECKIWKGAAVFTSSIDQLLRYLSWRDTKTAIILFNRNKNLSTVLSQIPIIVAQHPNFRQQVEYSSETGFRFLLRQNHDPSRDLILTVLVFDLPK